MCDSLKISNKSKLGTLLFLVTVILLFFLCKSEEIFSVTDVAENPYYDASPELTQGTEYVQTFPCFMDDVTAIGLQFANYANRTNQGTVTIKITSNGEPIGERKLDAAFIADGTREFVGLNREINCGEMVEVRVFSTSPVGKGVTIFSSEGAINLLNSLSGAMFSVNGAQQPTQLNVSLQYKSPKLAPSFYLTVGVLLVLMFVLRIPQEIYSFHLKRGKVRKFGFYLALFMLAFLIVTARLIMFIERPILFAEDGLFLSRQIKTGIVNNLFVTRSGKPNDFSNMGIYILLWLATKTTMFLDGFNLSELPIWVGVYGNLFFALTAVLGYRAFELLCAKRGGVMCYCAVIFVNLGNTANDTFGRTLNTQFLYTVTVAFLLIIQYVEDNPFSLKSLMIGLGCFISAYTFPICFLEIGIYLFAVILRSTKDKLFVKRLLGNIVELITLIAGLMILPRLWTNGSEGGAFTFDKTEVVEFFFARHILFPFVGNFYTKLNNTVTILLTSVYFAIIVAALLVEKKRTERWINNFSVFLAITFGVLLSSAYTRRTLTDLFDNYSTSFPNVYFYGCNILAFVLFIYAGLILTKKLKSNIRSALLVCSLMLLLNNPHFICGHTVLYGEKYIGSFSDLCKKAITENSEKFDTCGNITLELYPRPAWHMDLPAKYVFATATGNYRLK